MRLSVENWRIRNIGYPVLFPSSHGLSLTPYSPIFPSKLLEVKTWMGAAADWGREASAEPFVPATLVVVLPGLELASLPFHPCLLKYPLKAQTHCPGEASLCGPPQAPSLSFSRKSASWENSFGPDHKLPEPAAAFSSVRILSFQPHGGPRRTFEEPCCFLLSSSQLSAQEYVHSESPQCLGSWVT